MLRPIAAARRASAAAARRVEGVARRLADKTAPARPPLG
jgi:hypothetical protein